MAQILPRVVSIFAKLAITSLLLGLLFSKINYSATLRHLRDISPFTAFLGLALLYAAIALSTMRWLIVLRSIGQNFSYLGLFRLNVIGFFFSQALPSAVGGDGMRVWFLYRQGCSFARAFNSVLIDRIAGFAILAVMSLYGLPTLIERLFSIPQLQTIVALVAAGALTSVLLWSLARMGSFKSRVGRFIGQIVADTVFLAARPGESAKIAVLSICSQATTFVLIWLIMRDLGADVSFAGVMTVAPVVILLLVLPISIAAWGLREGLFVVGFGLLHVSEDVALATSILFGLIGLAAGVIGGAFWFLEPAPSRRPAMHPLPTARQGLSGPPTEKA